MVDTKIDDMYVQQKQNGCAYMQKHNCKTIISIQLNT